VGRQKSTLKTPKAASKSVKSREFFIELFKALQAARATAFTFLIPKNSGIYTFLTAKSHKSHKDFMFKASFLLPLCALFTFEVYFFLNSW
jgi:hypothetical protein